MQPALSTASRAKAYSFDPIAFLQTIVAIDSCDPPGGELAVAEAVHRELQTLGIESQLDVFLPGRANVLGRIRGRGEKPALVLSSHMDTVPVGTVPWSRDAFSGAIENGRLHGRGSSDMKSALAAMIAAAAEIGQAGDLLAGDVILAFTAGESDDLLGARRFVAQGLQKEIGVFLCGEPSSLDLVIVEKAVLWLRARATGRLGHVSGDPGVNAIEPMLDFLPRLSGLSLDVPAHPLLDGPTVRIGRISGGSAVNLTPDSCTADIDIRLPPGVDHRTVVAAVEALAGERISIEVLDVKPSVESSPEESFVKLCADVCGRHRRRSPAIRGTAYYSDAAVLLDGLSVPFVIVGPGDLGISGQADESVSIENVALAARIYRDVAREWLA